MGSLMKAYQAAWVGVVAAAPARSRRHTMMPGTQSSSITPAAIPAFMDSL